MQCSRCHKEISEKQSYVNKGKVYCEDCLMDVGLNTRECDPWATYVDNRTRAQAGQKGTDGLSETEKMVYNFIKNQGKATRAEVIQGLKLTSSELQVNLLPMFHAEIVKEKSEGGNQYLVVLK
jgi:late competence protein required for DNA uptake (superfamily II DNA/RNA helicase)